MANTPAFSPFAPGELPIEAIVETPVTPVAEVNAPEVPPVVETAPVVEPVVATITEPIVETPAVEAPIVEPTAAQERIVEKIVEKYPEMDEYTSEIFTALLEGKEDILLSYLAEKHRDYKTMSDYDAIKASIKKTNPNYTDEIAELKMERQYGELVKIDLKNIDATEEPEQYEAAEVHNKKVEENLKLLKLDAFDARLNLEAGKKEIKLPKIQAEAPPINNEPTPEALAQAQQDWLTSVDDATAKLTEFTFKVGDKDGGYEDVSYKLTDQDRKAEKEFLKDLNTKKLFERLGWMDASGKQNVLKMAGDVLKLERAEKIAAIAYTQGKTAGQKGTIAEIKNIDLSGSAATSVANQPIDIGLIGFGHLNPK